MKMSVIHKVDPISGLQAEVTFANRSFAFLPPFCRVMICKTKFCFKLFCKDNFQKS